MKKLIHYEWVKLLGAGRWPIILLCLLLVNAGLIWQDSTRVGDGYYSKGEQAAFYADHSGETPEEIYAVAAQALETAYVNTPAYASSTYGEVMLYTDILSHMEELMGYGDYLAGIEANARQMLSSSLFVKPGTFSYRLIERTPGIYEKLAGTQLAVGDSNAIISVTEQPVMVLCVILAMLPICLQLFVAERESELLRLIRPMKHGPNRLVLAKLVTMAVALLLVLGLFYGVNFGVAVALYGFDLLLAPIQSVSGYLTSPWLLTGGEYLLLHFTLTWLGLLAVMGVFGLLCILLGRQTTARLAFVLILGAELGLYVAIDVHSVFAPLRQLNLVALLNSATFFQDYCCMNLLQYPISALGVSMTGALVVLAVTFPGIVRGWRRTEGGGRKTRLPRLRPPRWRHTGLFGHEVTKLLVEERGLLLLALLLAVQIVSYGGQEAPTTDLDEFYYQQYAAQLGGELTEEKRAFLQSEQLRFDTATQTMEEYYQSAAAGEISYSYAAYMSEALEEELKAEDGFLRALEQYDYLEGQLELGRSVTFVPDTGFRVLADNEGADVLDGVKLALVLALGLSNFFAMEHTSGVQQLIQTAPGGRRRVIARKLGAGMIYGLLAVVIAYLPRILWVLGNYPLDDWLAGAASLSLIEHPLPGLSILGQVIAANVLRLVTALGCVAGICWLSAKTRHHTITLLSWAAVLEVPAMTCLFGVTGQWLLLPLLTGALLL